MSGLVQYFFFLRDDSCAPDDQGKFGKLTGLTGQWADRNPVPVAVDGVSNAMDKEQTLQQNRQTKQWPAKHLPARDGHAVRNPG